MLYGSLRACLRGRLLRLMALRLDRLLEGVGVVLVDFADVAVREGDVVLLLVDEEAEAGVVRQQQRRRYRHRHKVMDRELVMPVRRMVL